LEGRFLSSSQETAFQFGPKGASFFLIHQLIVKEKEPYSLLILLPELLIASTTEVTVVM